MWMKRPDLPLGYGGWQVLDATPQEASDGNTLTMLNIRIYHGSEIAPCNKRKKPLVVYRFSGKFIK